MEDKNNYGAAKSFEMNEPGYYTEEFVKQLQQQLTDLRPCGFAPCYKPVC